MKKCTPLPADLVALWPGPCCDVCGLRLERPGALVFSPPKARLVSKLHVCVGCYKGLVAYIAERAGGGPRPPRKRRRR